MDKIILKERASPIRLTDAQKWDIAKFIIESKGVTLKNTDEGLAYEFRARVTTLANEVSEKLFKITVPLVKVSMDFYVLMCNLTDKMPVIPVPIIQDTVKEDMLTAEVVKLQEEIKRLSRQLEETHKQATRIENSHIAAIQNYRERFAQIKKWSTL